MYVSIHCIALFLCIHMWTTANSGLTNPTVDRPQ